VRYHTPKRAAQEKEYKKLCILLDELSDKKSDLSGGPTAEHHHITGRRGLRLIDPFNIACLTKAEHGYEQAHHSWERQQELLAIIRPIRIKQGFKEKILVNHA
jgi:hypothetical protein